MLIHDNGQAAHVVVVDDDPRVREVVTAILTHGGYEVQTASSGEEALTLLQALPPDVVVLDIDLPGMSGWETLAAIRNDPRLRATRVVHSARETLSPPTDDHPQPDGSPRAAR